MPGIDDLLREMRRDPAGVRFRDLCRVCDQTFGPHRPGRGSHRIYRTPWPGDPRVNIQSDRGMAKAYQVRQVLKAIDAMRRGEDAR